MAPLSYDQWSTIKLNNGRAPLIEAAWRFASQCANASVPVVFCPPVCTFNNANKADVASIANGLAVTVELDANPSNARDKIEGVLGEATVVVASGGIWTDPETKAAHDKLHVHWRLAVPTRTAIEHDFLRECRKLATRHIGGDASAIPALHPLRWPGTWHRKATPRLARIVSLNLDIEIDWKDALTKLRAVAESKAGADDDDAGPQAQQSSGDPQADPLDICAAVAVIPNDNLDWQEWNKIGLAAWRASGGSDAGLAAFCAWSSRSTKFNRGRTEARWTHYATSPPDRIGAGTLFHLAKAARPDFVRPSERVKPPPAAGDAPRTAARERPHPAAGQAGTAAALAGATMDSLASGDRALRARRRGQNADYV